MPAVFRDSILQFLSDPNVAVCTFALGVGAIEYELCHPGYVIPGALGAVVSLTALYSLRQYPWTVHGMLLLAAALAIGAASAWRWSWPGYLIASVVAATALRLLLRPPLAWPIAAAAAIPTTWISCWLLATALRASELKWSGR